MMPITTTRWDSAEHLKTEEDIQLYLEACLEEAGDDPAFIVHALGVVARARKMNKNANGEIFLVIAETGGGKSLFI